MLPFFTRLLLLFPLFFAASVSAQDTASPIEWTVTSKKTAPGQYEIRFYTPDTKGW